jgi:predicted protein tyrosine phosphatase
VFFGNELAPARRLCSSRSVNKPVIHVTTCGLDELVLHRPSGVTHVLSILDPGWSEPTEFDLWERHDRLLLRFHDVIEDQPLGGMTPPNAEHLAAILQFGRKLPVDRPVRLLVHCHAGVSRSTASAVVLLAQREPARDPHDIVAEICRDRPQAWPNLRIIEIGDELLGRRGGLVEAAHRRYREVAAARPDIAEAMRAGGRGREALPSLDKSGDSSNL